MRATDTQDEDTRSILRPIITNKISQITRGTRSLRYYNIFVRSDCKVHPAYYFSIAHSSLDIGCIIVCPRCLRSGRWLFAHCPGWSLVPTPHTGVTLTSPGPALYRTLIGQSDSVLASDWLSHLSPHTNQNFHPCGAILRPALTSFYAGCFSPKNVLDMKSMTDQRVYTCTGPFTSTCNSLVSFLHLCGLFLIPS